MDPLGDGVTDQVYAVRFVKAADLPEGHDWVLTQDEGANICALFVREDSVCPEILTEAWAGYRRLTCRDDLVPRQREGDEERAWPRATWA